MAVAVCLSVGVGFSAFLIVLLLFGGGEALSDLGVSPVAAILLYLLGALAGGIVAGLLNPLAHSRVGFVAVGIAATVPMSIGTGVLLSGAFWERPESLFAFVFTTVVFGGGVALIIRDSLYHQNTPES